MSRTPVFIHIPKTGGSSINSALLPLIGKKSMIGHSRFEKIRRPKQRYVFTFIRDPYDRAISIFEYFKQRQQDNGWNLPAEKMLDRKFPKFEIMSAMAQAMTVSQFYESVNLTKLRKHLIHFRQQSWFVGRHRNQVHFYDFGNIESEFQRLCYDLGIPETPTLPHIRKTVRTSSLLSEAAKSKIEYFFPNDFALVREHVSKTEDSGNLRASEITPSRCS